MKKSRSSRSRMCFYREDILELQAILRRLIGAHQLEGCLVYSRNGHSVTEEGTIPPSLRESLLAGKRTGTDLGHHLRLAGFRAGEIIALEGMALRELKVFLDGIAVRKEFGDRLIATYSRPHPPRRA